MKAYYEARAHEYDDWWLGRGGWAGRDGEDWDTERDALIDTLHALPFARTLDVACGTGYLTRHLPGDAVGLDQSETMCELAGRYVETVRSDAIPLPFADCAFERIFTSHFYGHLEDAERVAFLAEARRVAPELVVVDASRAHSTTDEEWQTRVLNNGSKWKVYKRYFTPKSLTAELGGGVTLHAGHWFVAVRA